MSRWSSINQTSRSNWSSSKCLVDQKQEQVLMWCMNEMNFIFSHLCWDLVCLVRIYIKGQILLKTTTWDYQRDDLTTVSPVYSEDPPVQHRDASHRNLLFYSQSDPDRSGVRGLISELKPEQHNLHLWRHNNSTCREQWHTLHSLRSDQFICESINKEKVQINVWWIIGLRFKMTNNKKTIINHLKPHSRKINNIYLLHCQYF